MSTPTTSVVPLSGTPLKHGSISSVKHDAALPDTPPPSSPKPITYSSLASSLVNVKAWVDRSGTEPYRLQGISLQDFELLETHLRRLGIKLRSEWRHDGQIAILKVPTDLHNLPGAWLCEQLPYIQAMVDEAALCGRPKITASFDTNVELEGVGRFSPDQQLKVILRFGEGEKAKRAHLPAPRIVLETAYSQTRGEVEDKAADYLHAPGEHVHAVAICNMTYPVTLESNFRTEIAVFTREMTGTSDIDYPFENTRHIEHEPRGVSSDVLDREQSTESALRAEISPPKSSGSSSLASGDSPAGDQEPGLKTIPGRQQKVWLRSGYQVILDEKLESDGPTSHSTDDFAISLNIYDLLRCCPSHSKELPPKYGMSLPLAPLRESIVWELENLREQLKLGQEPVPAVHRSGELQGSSTAPPAPSSAQLKRV
ncbi:hypothetical protein FS749_007417 [Ceratobasidium sp. UAMH 11750]|nr:hypothetical protein FS749_007417 [Ceratobasidium sp. UAMH 11750]